MNNPFDITTSNQSASEEMIKEFTKEVIRLVKEEFKAEGGVSPALFIVKETDNKPVFGIFPGVAEMMNSDENKDKLSQVIKALVKKLKPVCICLVTEAWMVEVPAKNNDMIDKKGRYKKDAKTPSEHPDRVEVIILNFETYTKEMRIVLEIKRDKNPPYIQEKEGTEILSKWTNKGRGTGKFANLLSHSSDNENMTEDNIKVKNITRLSDMASLIDDEDSILTEEDMIKLFDSINETTEKVTGIKSDNAFGKNTRVIKTNSEEGDTTEDGVEGTVLSYVGTPPTELLPVGLRSKNVKFAYLVKWDNFKHPVLVIDYKLKLKE